MAKCYDGAWDSETQRRFDEEDRVMRAIRRHEPEASCTLHHNPDLYHVHVWGRAIGPWRSTRLAAKRAALERLE